MIRITPQVRTAMIAHALAQRPLEACGLVSALDGTNLVDVFHAVSNAAASPVVFTLEPAEMLEVERTAEAAGRDIVGVMHSHVDSSPYPSATDQTDSARYDPMGTYRQFIVSLRHAEPSVRCYRIVDGDVTEVPVVIDEPGPTAHDGADAAVVALPKPPT